MTKAWLAGLSVAAATIAVAQPAARPVPYWASLSAGEARMRTGPGRNYPTSWLYRRAGLPMRVIQVYPGWRKVRDPDGAEGWMIASLLSAQRTAMVRDGGAELHTAASNGAAVAYRAGSGVVGRISHCGGGWCGLDIAGREGYARTERLWGVEPDETVD